MKSDIETAFITCLWAEAPYGVERSYSTGGNGIFLLNVWGEAPRRVRLYDVYSECDNSHTLRPAQGSVFSTELRVAMYKIGPLTLAA